MNWTRLLLTGVIPVSSLVYFNTRIFKVCIDALFFFCLILQMHGALFCFFLSSNSNTIMSPHSPCHSFNKKACFQ